MNIVIWAIPKSKLRRYWNDPKYREAIEKDSLNRLIETIMDFQPARNK
jgi:hypothetical protein